MTIYKPYGTAPTDEMLASGLQLSDDSLVFGLMTKTQREALMDYGKTILCLDSTHKVTQYDNFKLLTACDQYGEGKLYFCSERFAFSFLQ